MLLSKCRYIITQDENRTILENKDMRIEDGKIVEIGEHLGEGIDCSNKIVLPGLINTHTHLGMHSLRGICDDKELFPWLEKVQAAESKLTKEDILDNTIEGLREAVRFGTTTLFDSYDYAQERFDLFIKHGIRGVISSSVAENGLEEAEQFVKNTAGKSDLVKPVIAAHSVYACSEAVLKKIIELSNTHNILRRIHTGETRKERFQILEEKGKLVVEYLDSINFLDEKTLLVHAIWITKGEVNLLSKARAKVSHNPIANMKLASGGIMPLIEMKKENIAIGLGTDSVVSNNNLDMFEEMKVCALLHKAHRWDASAITAQDILDMATIDAAKCLRLENVGAIKEDWQADIITIPLTHHLRPVNNLISNIVYCANGTDVADVIINGKLKVQEGKVLF